MNLCGCDFPFFVPLFVLNLYFLTPFLVIARSEATWQSCVCTLFTRLLRLKSRNDWYRKKIPIYIIPLKVKIYATWWEKKWKKSVFFIWLIISKNPIKNIPSLWKEFVLCATMTYFQRMFVVTNLNIYILVCVFFVILFHFLLQMHTKYHKCNLVCKLSFF